MNKYLFILGLVGIAFLSGCTSDDLAMVPSLEEERALIVEASQDSDVPITLGIASSRGYTRAPINPSDVEGGYGNFETEPDRYLGVFCLSTGIQSDVDASNLPTNIQKNAPFGRVFFQEVFLRKWNYCSVTSWNQSFDVWMSPLDQQEPKE